MINREITYERGVNKSYMKIPTQAEGSLDEELMLHTTIEGLVSVEKSYIGTAGQYWYNISGLQALDAYCRVEAVDYAFFEKLILRLCEQVERLEWNLIDSNCLVLDPELVFVTHGGEDIYFVIYPYNRGTLFEEMTVLMEFVLSKLKHEDKEAVQSAYKIYEMCLSESFSLKSLKEQILAKRMEKMRQESAALEVEITEETEMQSYEQEATPRGEIVGTGLWAYINLLLKYKDAVLEEIQSYRDKISSRMEKKDAFLTVYPEEAAAEENPAISYHPTICLSEAKPKAKGILLCEAHGQYPDFTLDKTAQIIGKNPKVQHQLNRETISQFHARIDYEEGGYYIEDLNSTNGTGVNGVSLKYKEKLMLNTGDSVEFADVKYHFY